MYLNKNQIVHNYANTLLTKFSLCCNVLLKCPFWNWNNTFFAPSMTTGLWLLCIAFLEKPLQQKITSILILA